MAQRRGFDSKIDLRWATSRLASIGLLFRKAASEWRRDNALQLSAAVSFYTVLSLAPLLVIVIRAMGIAHARQFARQQIIRQVTNLMGKQATEAIKPIIESSATQSIGSLATAIRGEWNRDVSGFNHRRQAIDEPSAALKQNTQRTLRSKPLTSGSVSTL